MDVVAAGCQATIVGLDPIAGLAAIVGMTPNGGLPRSLAEARVGAVANGGRVKVVMSRD